MASVLALAVATSFPSVCVADADSDKNAAAALADAGLTQMQRGDARSALDLFARASALVPASTFALFEARCLVTLERFDDADAAYARAESFDDGPNATPAQKQAIAEARSERAALRKKRGLSPRPLLEPTPAHLPAAKPSATASTPPPPPAPSADTTARHPAKLTWVALGVGAAGLTVGVVSGLIMTSKKHALDDDCADSRCPASSSDQLDSFRSARTVSFVGWGVGLVGLGVGAGLWLAAPRTPSQSASVSLVAGPTSVALRGSF